MHIVCIFATCMNIVYMWTVAPGTGGPMICTINCSILLLGLYILAAIEHARVQVNGAHRPVYLCWPFFALIWLDVVRMRLVCGGNIIFKFFETTSFKVGGLLTMRKIPTLHIQLFLSDT